MANLAHPQNETTPNLEINASYTRQDWDSFQPIPAKKLSPRNRSHPKALALWKAVAKWQCLAHTTDISQIAFKSMAIISKLRRHCNSFPSVAFRWPDFGELAVTGRSFSHFFHRPGISLPHFSPRSRCPRPTPERVFVGDHQSSPRFSGTVPSAQQPRLIGT